MNGLPPGYALRAASVDDAEAVARIIEATQLAETGKAHWTADEVLNQWQDINRAEEAVVVTTLDGDVVAAADLLNRSYISVSVYGYVHTEHQGQGIGQTLVNWGEHWIRDRISLAQPDARVVIKHYVHSESEAARRLFEESGYVPVRGVYTMEIELTEPPPAPEWPDGISVRTFIPGQDERATHEAVEDTFRDVWGRPKNTFEFFLRRTHADAFIPNLWFLAGDSEGIAGDCLCKMFGGQGIVDNVGVRRPWRGRGLGLAMLRHAFGAFYQRDIHNAWLSVDAESITGAPRLYHRAGMHVTGTYILHQEELRAGIDLGQRGLE